MSTSVYAPELPWRYCTFHEVAAGPFGLGVHFTRNPPGAASIVRVCTARGVPVVKVHAGDQATGVCPLVYAI